MDLPDKMIFPLAKNPDYPLTETLEDAVLRSQMEDGTVLTRPKFTKNRKTFDVQWGHLTNEEKQTLDRFYRQDLKNGSASFDWTNPVDGVKYTVRFSDPPAFKAIQYGGWWSVMAKFQEV